MIFEPQSYSLIFQDAVYSMAVGFITGFVYQLLGVFLYNGRAKQFVRDIIAGLVFTVLIFSYSISFANYPILRWYMVLFALLGAVLFTPRFARRGNIMLKLVAVTLRFFTLAAAKKFRGKLLDISEKNKQKKQKFPQKNRPEVLKTNDIMLYN